MTWPRKHWTSLTLAGIILLALGLRLVNIRAEPLWYDEVMNTALARSAPDLGTVIRQAGVLFHPPLFPLAIRWWTNLVGFTELTVRLPSVVAGVLTALLAWFIARRWFSPRAGLIAAGLVAVSPLAVEFGQEGRPYAFLMLVGLASIWMLFETLERPRWWSAAGFLTSTAIACATHVSALLLLMTQTAIVIAAPHISTLLTFQRPRRTQFALLIGAWALAGFALLPVIRSVAMMVAYADHHIGMAPPDVVPVALFFPRYAPDPFVEHYPLNALRAETIAGVVGLFTLLALLVKARRAVMAGVDPTSAILRLLIIGIAVSSVLFVISPLSSIYTSWWHRQLLASSGFLLLATAGLLDRVMRTNRVGAALASFLLIVSMTPFLWHSLANDAKSNPTYQVPAIIQSIAARAQEGDLIIVRVPMSETTFRYYALHTPGTPPIISLLESRNYDPFAGDASDPAPLNIEIAYHFHAVPAEERDANVVERLTQNANRLWVTTAGESVASYLPLFMEHGWKPVDCLPTFCDRVVLLERQGETTVPST